MVSIPTLMKNYRAEYIAVLVGAACYAAGVNLFILPLYLYSSGIVGMSQLISDLLCSLFHSFDQADLNGIVYMAINIPLLLFAWGSMGHTFLTKTIIGTFGISFFMSLIPCPSVPIMPDYTAAVILGGCVCGFGMGIIMTARGSGGGLDIVGVWMAKHNPHFSVGKLSRLFNCGLILVYLVKFQTSVVLYTFMFIMVQSLILDRTHYQNITVRVTIITKLKGLEKSIMNHTARGITMIHGIGAYTGDNTEVLITVISKYELDNFREAVHQLDPSAFIVIDEGVIVEGNFKKRI